MAFKGKDPVRSKIVINGNILKQVSNLNYLDCNLSYSYDGDRFLPHVHYSYANALQYLKLHTLRKRRYHLDALFLIQVCRGLKYCPSLLEAVGLRVPTRYPTDFSMFNFSPSSKKLSFF
jgi:hypothetical protein